MIPFAVGKKRAEGSGDPAPVARILSKTEEVPCSEGGLEAQAGLGRQSRGSMEMPL